MQIISGELAFILIDGDGDLYVTPIVYCLNIMQKSRVFLSKSMVLLVDGEPYGTDRRGLGKVFFFFFLNFLLDQGPVCGATDCSCFGLRVSFLMGFKSEVDLSPALFLACVR